jgi:hypothetical protein
MSNHATNRNTELADEELTAVTGGLNPQPLPPRIAFELPFVSFSRFAAPSFLVR